jgi:hypothetical protein
MYLLRLYNQYIEHCSLSVDCNTPPHLKRKKKKKENNQFLLPKPKKQTIIQRDDKVLRQKSNDKDRRENLKK